MPEDGAPVHPVISALEKADEPTVVIDGYLGTSIDYAALERSGRHGFPGSSR